MKRFYTLCMIALFSLPMTAQSTDSEEFSILQNAFQMTKKDLVSQYLALQGEQATGFWTLYDEYEAKRMALGKERFQIIKDYAAQYASLTDEQATMLVGRASGTDKSILDLKKTYFKKFSKVLGGKNAAKFYQIDAYLDLIVKNEIMDSIPFIDELSKKDKSK